MFSNICSLISRENDENCVVDNMFTVFWFNKQNEFENSGYVVFKIYMDQLGNKGGWGATLPATPLNRYLKAT
jgi:hypothetical protein